MIDRPTPLERAFQLARSGQYANVSDVRKQLRAEGISDAQIEGGVITRQIRDLCTAAQQAAEE